MFTATSSAWLGPDNTTIALSFFCEFLQPKLIRLCVSCSSPLLACIMIGLVFILPISYMRLNESLLLEQQNK